MKSYLDSLMNLGKVLEDVAGNLHTVAGCQKISDEVIESAGVRTD